MKFDKMVESGNYSRHDSFISIGYTFGINDIEFGSDLPVEPKSGRFLRILFDDVLWDFQDTKAIDLNQANEIIEFCDELEPDSTLHIHGQDGQSRSVAVAIGLSEHLQRRGFDVDLEHSRGEDISPNMLVLSMIRKASKEQK